MFRYPHLLNRHSLSQLKITDEEIAAKKSSTNGEATVALCVSLQADRSIRSHKLAFTVFCKNYLAPGKTKLLKEDIYRRYFAWLEKHLPYPSRDPDSDWGSLAKVGISSFALLNPIFAIVFPNCPETRKYLYAKWVTPPSTIRPLKELVICRLLRDNNTLWFELWSSPTIFWTPLDLRAWMLSFGAQLRNDILVSTVERYYANVNRKLAGATAEIPRTKGLKGTCLVEESVQAEKKQRRSRREFGSITVDNIENIVAKDSRLEEGIEIMREFLRLGNPKASFLRKCPVALGTVDAGDNQVAEYWLPTISYFFGSIETFLFHFSRTTEGINALQRLIESGNVDDLIKEQMQRFMEPAIREWRNRLQDNTDAKAVAVYKGTHLATQSLHRLNTVLTLEAKTDAAVRFLAKGSSSSPLPLVLRDAPELIKQVTGVVRSHQGGWGVISWSDTDFVKQVINYSVEAQESTATGEAQYTRAQQFLLNKCSTVYVERG